MAWWDARLQPDERDPLSIGRITTAAIVILDQDGFNSLTMRRVATYLGVSAPTLYRYVDGRDALLVEALESVLGDVDLDVPEEHWGVMLRWLARSTRETLLTHPGLAPLLASVPMLGPNARAIMRAGILVCRRAGIPHDLARATCGALAYEVRSSLIYERADLLPLRFCPGTLVERESLAFYSSPGRENQRPTTDDEMFEFLVGGVINSVEDRVRNI